MTKAEFAGKPTPFTGSGTSRLKRSRRRAGRFGPIPASSQRPLRVRCALNADTCSCRFGAKRRPEKTDAKQGSGALRINEVLPMAESDPGAATRVGSRPFGKTVANTRPRRADVTRLARRSASTRGRGCQRRSRITQQSVLYRRSGGQRDLHADGGWLRSARSAAEALIGVVVGDQGIGQGDGVVRGRDASALEGDCGASAEPVVDNSAVCQGERAAGRLIDAR